ncbi:hypothetical protein DPMN_015156 [Dreissena polymorpha]|uniref:Uncharacterized protein n=1 Tax=Dreissena polymorpha TaxID=45954 RepID=A0A9D4N8M8_DREPO|nr:hypothetical protein DPMN_015156 [Dreissena polymorpha]
MGCAILNPVINVNAHSRIVSRKSYILSWKSLAGGLGFGLVLGPQPNPNPNPTPNPNPYPNPFLGLSPLTMPRPLYELPPERVRFDSRTFAANRAFNSERSQPFANYSERSL